MADASNGVLIILAVIIAGVVWLLSRGVNYWSAHNRRRFSRALLSDLYPLPEDGGNERAYGIAGPKLKAGDVLLYIAHTNGFTNSVITLDLFSHGGMIVDDDKGHLYSTEVTPFTRNPDSEIIMADHARTRPLLTRLKYYAGALFALRLNKPLDFKRKEHLRLLAFNGRGADYPGLVQCVGTLLGLRSRAPGITNARHCMEHVAWLVDSMGLTPLSLSKQNKTVLGLGFLRCSQGVSSLDGQKLPDGYQYLDPIQILYDLDVVKQS